MVLRHGIRVAPWTSAVSMLAFLLTLPFSLPEAAPRKSFKALNMISVSGLAAPEFVLPMLGGSNVRLADFKGSVVFLNFWATYCEPCRSEMASIEALQKQFHQDDLVVLAISIGESAKSVESYLASNPVTFPVLLDRRKLVARMYAITAVPSTFLIDREGRLLAKALGPRNWASPPALSLMMELVKGSGE